MLFIQNSRVIDPKTGTDAVLDLIIENGKIVDMGENLAERCQALASENGSSLQILDGKGLITAPGFIDVHVHFRDPGFTGRHSNRSKGCRCRRIYHRYLYGQYQAAG